MKKNEEKIYIKNKNIFKNPIQMVVYLLLFIVIIGLFIYISKIDFKKNKDISVELSKVFDRLPADNVFISSNALTVKNVINEGNGIIFFGTNNEWVNYYITMVNDAAKDVGIKEIYYYDFIDNKINNNTTYDSIVDALEPYVLRNDRGFTNIYAPTLVIIKNGVVLFYDDETAFVRGNENPKDYWNYSNQYSKVEELKDGFIKYLEG